jgi:hypothetical protein
MSIRLQLVNLGKAGILVREVRGITHKISPNAEGDRLPFTTAQGNHCAALRCKRAPFT